MVLDDPRFFMVAGPALLLFGAVRLTRFALGRGTRRNDGGSLKRPAWSLVALLGGLAVTGAGYAPAQPITFKVGETLHRYDEYRVFVAGSDATIVVPEADGSALRKGEVWTCKIHKVPIVGGHLGACQDGHEVD